MDRTYIYDERPGFESYNMVNFPMGGMPMMYPMNNQSGTCSNSNNYDNRKTKLENEVSNLQNRISRLEGNIYPQAIDYNTYPKQTYQNSLNVL